MKTSVLSIILVFFSILGCAKEAVHPAPDVGASGEPALPVQVVEQPIKEELSADSTYFVAAKYLDKTKKSLVINEGMAVAIKSNGKVFLLTCKHLAAQGEIIVRPWRDENKLFPAKLEAVCPDCDAALLSVSSLNPQTKSIPLSSGRPFIFGLPVTAFGGINPTADSTIGQKQRLFLQGYLAGEMDVNQEGKLFLADLYTLHGFSGGGVYDDQQQLLGIMTGKIGGETSRSLSYILPITRIQSWLEDLEGVRLRKDQPQKH